MAFSRAHILISVSLWEPRKFPMITHKVYTAMIIFSKVGCYRGT